MLIDGKKIALALKEDLLKDIEDLKRVNILPKIAIVTFKTTEDTWSAYVNRKIMMAQDLGAAYEHIVLSNDNEIELFSVVDGLNKASHVHGIIIQRPIPVGTNKVKVIECVNKYKDIDGFRNDSPYQPPIWLAVEKILEYIAKFEHNPKVYSWLLNKKIVILGRGESAGNPIIKGFQKHGINPIVVHGSGNSSDHPNSAELLKEADIIITAVGKKVIEKTHIKSGVVLIGVGLHKEMDGKLHGDYEEEEIKGIASYYTPTPGGVGPVNVISIFKNLVKAAKYV